MNDLVKEYMETGKDLNTILKDRIKANNRQWFLVTLLIATIFGGYAYFANGRALCVIEGKRRNDSIHKVDSLTIYMQYNALDSAVYFREIKNR